MQSSTRDDKPLYGKVAVVTGASSGIGAAISRQLAAAGAKVAMAARRENLLKKIQDEISKEGGAALAVRCDVTNRAEVKELIQHTESTLGPVDILVNNAGIWVIRCMKNLHEEEWDQQVDVNIKGVLNCIGAVISGMCERKRGHIVNMSSQSGKTPLVGIAVYTGSKFFVEGMSRTLRQEVCKDGVRVTCIQPGEVETPGFARYLMTMEDEQVAVVTGASCGIGAAISRQLAAAGAKVAMAARRVNLLKEIQDDISKEGGVALAVKCDVTNRAEVKELIQHTESTLGPVDILVNNAGYWVIRCMKNLHEEEWDQQVDVNIKGVLNCIGAVISGMCERKSGHIVNMSSENGKKAFVGFAVYTGSKFFVEGMSRTLRKEVCKDGVRVTCIQPGDVETPGYAHSLMTIEDRQCKPLYTYPFPYPIMEPEVIAQAVLYAVTQPDHVAVNEILVQPRENPL
ncbi:uncharacterized protein LOC106154797 isoform X2 [Lingula anatina]|uniref:NADP-dependent 3-hydroxy acid dehydrogenase YdfG n=1 Tax=Lingula anatina TaxID=7574 RepID=A0A1S3HF94_LINAN|nr:uncharacterized protein LOC106154797 isoform X2 [Lingula anatina]|eukprot:XP_013384743.1 uncharacterized protein LOC106154797 isoform X2 [Lingula anatina]